MRFSETFTVPDKTPQECFDYVTNPDNGTEWAGAAKEIHAEGEPGVGRRIIAKVDLVLSFDITQTVTAWDPPTHYAFGATSPMKVDYDFTFSEAGSGTKVACVLDADPGKFIPGGSLLLKGRFKKEFQRDMASLEKALTNA